MTLYYQDETVQVTSGAIRAGGYTIPLDELTYVWHARGPTSGRAWAHRLGRGTLILLFSIPPLVAIVCVVSLAYAAHARGDWLLAGLIVAACVIGGLALLPFLEVPLSWLDRSYDTGGGRIHELWAEHRGQQIMLLSTSDALRFGQIYRAVQRAVEQHGSQV